MGNEFLQLLYRAIFSMLTLIAVCACQESLVCKALSFAAQSGHVNVVKLLLEHDAHVDFLHEVSLFIPSHL